MKRIIAVFFLVFLSASYKGQCEVDRVKDTMSIQKDGKIVDGEYVQTTLKNLSVVRIFKTNDNRFYLRLIVTEDFYFNKVDVLEIKSGNKSYFAKDTKQHQVNKTTGLYVIEIFRNYIATLKEDGITSIAFGHGETDFTRQDASQVRKLARCIYETTFVKK